MPSERATALVGKTGSADRKNSASTAALSGGSRGPNHADGAKGWADSVVTAKGDATGSPSSDTSKRPDRVTPAQRSPIPAPAPAGGQAGSPTTSTPVTSVGATAGSRTGEASGGQPGSPDGRTFTIGTARTRLSPDTLRNDAGRVNQAAQDQAAAAQTGVGIAETVEDLMQKAKPQAQHNLDEVFGAVGAGKLLPSQGDYDRTGQALKDLAAAGPQGTPQDSYGSMVDSTQKKQVSAQGVGIGLSTQEDLIGTLRSTSTSNDEDLKDRVNENVSQSIVEGLTRNLGADPGRGFWGTVADKLMEKNSTTKAQIAGASQVSDLKSRLNQVDPSLDMKAIEEGLHSWNDGA